jgi:gamma-glutamyltranspeptidase/glutathione hydrolase
MRGVIAAGHPVTAQAGAEVLREGGNAVDAAVAAMLASFAAEPLLTGLGAGGYMLVAVPGEEAVLLDFFVEAPGRGAAEEHRAPLVAAEVSFGDAVQVFHVGAASCGAYGTPSGAAEATARFGTMPLADLAAPAVALARAGVALNEQQAYVFEILEPIIGVTPESRSLLMPEGRVPRAGDVIRMPELADALERLGAEGAEPFYTGDIGRAVADWVTERGGTLTREDLAAYRTVPREPLLVRYRDRVVRTNPAPNAGGPLLAFALEQLATLAEPPGPVELVDAMVAAQARRTPEFLSQLGGTTHISVLDADGLACSVTCSNGEGSGIVVPGTGVHVNNMMGEEDLSPLGFFTHPPGRRLPSMMAPTIVSDAEGPRLVLGSAGSNRIRSALLQVIVNVVDHGMAAGPAVEAPRLHFDSGMVYVEPGIPAEAIEAAGHEVARFRSRNLFFGGAQVVERDPATGELLGAGDPRRGGTAVTVSDT